MIERLGAIFFFFFLHMYMEKSQNVSTKTGFFHIFSRNIEKKKKIKRIKKVFQKIKVGSGYPKQTFFFFVQA